MYNKEVVEDVQTKSLYKEKRSSFGNNKNKYEVLSETVEDENSDLRVLKDRMMVDKFINEITQPTCTESSNWSKDMIKYFKDQSKIDRLKEQEARDENMKYLCEMRNVIAQTMIDDTIIGLGK
ncbi:hypothetical protein Tco_0439511, partial [Tanacetum coccineum]